MPGQRCWCHVKSQEARSYDGKPSPAFSQIRDQSQTRANSGSDTRTSFTLTSWVRRGKRVSQSWCWHSSLAAVVNADVTLGSENKITPAPGERERERLLSLIRIDRAEGSFVQFKLSGVIFLESGAKSSVCSQAKIRFFCGCCSNGRMSMIIDKCSYFPFRVLMGFNQGWSSKTKVFGILMKRAF